MTPPDCPQCYAPMQWKIDAVFACPNGHIDSLESIARMNLEAAFDEDGSLYALFYRGITMTGFDENSPEWNIDLIAHNMGATVHQIHLLIASDLARAEYSEKFVGSEVTA